MSESLADYKHHTVHHPESFDTMIHADRGSLPEHLLILYEKMWDFRQLRWLNYCGWWSDPTLPDRKRMLVKIYGYALYFFVLIQCGPELWTIIMAIKEKDFTIVVFNTNQMFVGFLWAFEVGFALWYEPKTNLILKKLKVMEKSVEGVIEEEVLSRLKEHRDLRCKMLLPYVYISVTTLVVWNFRPLFIHIFFGEKINIIDAWAPLDTTTLTGWTVMYIVHFVHSGAACCGIMFVHSANFCLLQMLHLQYDFLKYMLKNLHFPYQGRHKMSPNDLKFCISFHQQVIGLTGDVNDVLKHLLFYQIVIINCIICLSVFEFFGMESSSGMVRRTCMLFLGLLVIFVLLVYSVFCQDLEEENVKTTRAAYDNNWYEGTVGDKRDLLLLMECNGKARPFGLIVYYNLNLFISVMKSTFSYYQFLNTISE